MLTYIHVYTYIHTYIHTSCIKGFGKTKDYNTQTPADPNICGTLRRVLGTAMGYVQRPYEHQKRVEL
jgi:hypothetical protein